MKQFKRKGISFWQNRLHDKLTFSPSKPNTKWSVKLKIDITDQQWHKAIENNLSASKCSTYWEMVQKIHLRWYYIPYILVKFNSNHSSLCWRGCGLVGTLSLISIVFGIQSFRLISKLMGMISRPNSRLAILSVGIEPYPSDLRQMIIYRSYLQHVGFL